MPSIFNQRSGLTLVELLVVCTIISILATVAVVVYSGYQSKSRDTIRLANLESLNQAIYSVADESDNLSSDLCFDLTPPCSGSSYPENNDTKKADGTGWIKIDFTNQAGFNLPVLPVDPLNSSLLHYEYKSDGQYWQVTAVFESIDFSGKMPTDGGDEANKYEVGFKPQLIN